MIPMVQVAPDLRRARYAEWCYSERVGKYVAILLCEELIERRWEPFCAEIGCDGVFYVQRNVGLEALLPAPAAAWSELIWAEAASRRWCDFVIVVSLHAGTMRIHTVALGIDNCYLLEGEKYVFIDGGAPNRSRAFVKGMAALGMDPSKIALIVLTHAHWDHIGSVHALVELTGAKVAVHRCERPIVERGMKIMPPGVTPWGAIFGVILRAFLPFIVIPPTQVDVEIGDGGLSLEPYGVPGKVIHTPGHSSGSVSVVLDGGEAFVGDLAMNGFPLTHGPDLPIFAEDIGMVRESWKKLLKLGLTTVFPAHGKPFPISVMERRLAAS